MTAAARAAWAKGPASGVSTIIEVLEVGWPFRVGSKPAARNDACFAGALPCPCRQSCLSVAVACARCVPDMRDRWRPTLGAIAVTASVTDMGQPGVGQFFNVDFSNWMPCHHLPLLWECFGTRMTPLCLQCVYDRLTVTPALNRPMNPMNPANLCERGDSDS